MSSWEDNISLKNSEPYRPAHIGTVDDHLELNDDRFAALFSGDRPVSHFTARDTSPLPSTEDREGYYGPNHFNYWGSGLHDFQIIDDWFRTNGLKLKNYLDFGCATGRVIRHFAAQKPDMAVYGCDINRAHVDWCNTYLPDSVTVFQNTSIPTLPLATSSLDLVTAFSVFTHIEAFETSWLMELQRILKPGGIAWITIHGDRVWSDITHEWPLYTPLTSHPDYAQYADEKTLPEDRLVFRWHSDKSYSANVFYRYEYIRKHWGRFFTVKDIIPADPLYQDVVILQKPF